MDTTLTSLRPSTTPTTTASTPEVMFSDQQELALEWLMNGGSVTEAAQFAGVCRKTVSRWLSTDPDFRAVYDDWREQIATTTEGQLLGLCESAVGAIARAIRNRQDVRAAEFVLKHLATVMKRK